MRHGLCSGVSAVVQGANCAAANTHGSDLLQRHQRRHHADPLVPASASVVRAAQACRRCAASKLRCNDERPCQRCVRKGVQCSNIADTLQQQAREQDLQAPVQNATAGSKEWSRSADTDMPLDADPEATDSSQIPPNDCLSGGAGLERDLVDHPLVNPANAMPGVARQPPATPLLLPMLAWDYQWTPDVDSELFDFCFPNVLPDFSAPAALQSYTAPVDREDEERSPELIVSAEGAKAFHDSVWLWVPSSTDTRAANEPNPAQIPPYLFAMPADNVQLSAEILAKRLGPSERDRILAVILDQCEKASVVRIATSFPTHLILEQLLHTALHFQTVGLPLAWLHIPMLTVGTVRNELVCALVAWGAFLSPMAPVQALGSAMLDLIHHAIMAQWVSDNTTTRDLELCQAYALVQHLLLWAGSKRRMEFGEGITQPLVTIMRRSGMLQNHLPLPEPPSLLDDAIALKTKWQAWVQQESKVRLALQVFVQDMQTSMTQFINPLMACSEMNVPLPADDAIWSASTAEEWRTRWLIFAPDAHEWKRPLLSEVVRKAFLAPRRGRGSYEDTSTMSPSSVALQLYGLWDTIWNCRRTSSWLCTDNSISNTLPLGMSYQIELIAQVLEQIEPLITLPTTVPPAQDRQENPSVSGSGHLRSAENLLLFHYISLAFFAPLKRFPELAGKEGEAESNRAFLLLHEWTQNREGRRALWHAAQVFRNARLLPPSQMQNFFVVAVYHASLTFWAFSVVAGAATLRELRALKLSSTLLGRAAGNTVRLDAELSSAVEQYITYGSGSPAIASTQGIGAALVPVLYNPGAMLKLAVDIFSCSSQQCSTYDTPLFTCMVVKLMNDLSAAVQAVGYG